MGGAHSHDGECSGQHLFEGQPWAKKWADQWRKENKGTGYRVFNLCRGSPAHEVGLEIYFDFVIALDGSPVDANQAMFFSKIADKKDEECVLSIWSSKTNLIREVKLTPREWGGAGLLGATIRYDVYDSTKIANIRVTRVFENSPAEMAGIEPEEDFLLGAEGILFKNLEDLVELVQRFKGKCISMYVYNQETGLTRVIPVFPNDIWGGEGALGCEFGTGLLHRILPPDIKKEKEKFKAEKLAKERGEQTPRKPPKSACCQADDWHTTNKPADTTKPDAEAASEKPADTTEPPEAGKAEASAQPAQPSDKAEPNQASDTTKVEQPATSAQLSIDPAPMQEEVQAAALAPTEQVSTEVTGTPAAPSHTLPAATVPQAGVERAPDAQKAELTRESAAQQQPSETAYQVPVPPSEPVAQSQPSAPVEPSPPAQSQVAYEVPVQDQAKAQPEPVAVETHAPAPPAVPTAPAMAQELAPPAVHTPAPPAGQEAAPPAIQEPAPPRAEPVQHTPAPPVVAAADPTAQPASAEKKQQEGGDTGADAAAASDLAQDKNQSYLDGYVLQSFQGQMQVAQPGRIYEVRREAN